MPEQTTSTPTGAPPLPNVKLGNGAPALLSLKPGFIGLDPLLDKLRSDRRALDEKAAIERLATTIEEEGQEQPVLVRPKGPNDYVLVYGHRRLAAIKRLNEQGVRTNVLARVEELTDDQALRKALIENWQRKDFTVLEKARQVEMLRLRFGWVGDKGTKRIASHLGVSEATVTQMDRMVSLPADVLAQVDSGDMSARAALNLAQVKPAAVKPVSERALEIAKEQEAKRQADAPPEKRKAAPRKIKVEEKHVRKAAKELKATKGRKSFAPNLAEVRDWFDEHNSTAAYPKVLASLAGAVVTWLRTGKEAPLTKAWNALSTACDKPAKRQKAKAYAIEPRQKAAKRKK
jgi:ParB family transcriptional regulator, chromosome partitioning protein